jgi:DeoR/GlpR family transcriptional regulator of sugar metabolism
LRNTAAPAHPGQRLQSILAALENGASVSVNDLARRLRVTAMTVRRDLDTLERKGLLRRVRGGAVSAQGRSYEPPLLTRARNHPEEKQRIGAAAALLVKDGDSIAIDVGSTAMEVARHLVGRHNLTVVTPSVHVACALGEHAGMRIVLTGGVVRPGELSLVGSLAERAFKDFFVDKLFLGVGGFDFAAGLTEFNVEDAQVKRAMIASAKEVIVVTDASKFGRVAFAAVAGLDVVRHVVTDSRLRKDVASRLESMGLQVSAV